MFPDFPDDNKNEDFLNEFRQKIAEQSNISFEERRNELNRSKSVFIGAVSGVLLAGIVGWFILSPRYAQNENVELPVIRRPQTAVKVQPTEPGGMEILNQDKSVYDILDKTKNDTKVVENLLPPPEQPKLPEIVPSSDIVADTAKAGESSSKVIDQAEKIVATAKTPAPVKDEISEAQTQNLSQVVAQVAKAEPQVAEPKAEAKTESKVAETQPAQQAPQSVYNAQIKDGKVVSQSNPAPVQNAQNAIPVGTWQVQLISSNNKSSVEKSWSSLSKKYNVLSNQPYEIETADLGAKGIYYRLKAGAFKTRAEADNLCNDIKALGGSCIVKKK